MNKKTLPPGEGYKVRCPRLGHMINFAYCRIENRGLPCFKILDCWFEHFGVEDHLRQELNSEEWETIFNRPPKNKMGSLLELIEQAKQGKDEAE
jgi:hypothetical protein